MHTPGPWWTGSDEDAHMVYSGNASTVEAAQAAINKATTANQ